MVIRNVSEQHTIPAIYDVCAIGNALVDIIAESSDAFLESYGIVKGAMTLIDEERADFLYKNMGAGVEMSGGSAGNTAAGIASLGGKPAYIGKVKNDQFGEIFRHDMHAMGVCFESPATTEGPSTGRSLIIVTPDAQRSMNTYLGACGDLSSDDIIQKLVANSQVTYLEGYLFDKPKAKEAFRLAAKIAHDAGRRLSLTLSDTFCVDRHRADFLALVRDEVDILLANEFELMALYALPTVEEALDAARTECSIVVATRSEKGALIASGNQTISVQADPMGKIVDSTGAGDLFASGFLFGLTHGYDLQTSGRLGALAAGEVISHYGPRPQTDLKELAQARGIKI